MAHIAPIDKKALLWILRSTSQLKRQAMDNLLKEDKYTTPCLKTDQTDFYN